MDDSYPGAGAFMDIELVVCLAPRKVQAMALRLPWGATLGDALRCSDWPDLAGQILAGRLTAGVWGRVAGPDTVLKPLDRVEIYRALMVDPKVARRQRFARQGARTTGLFASQRPGGKAGY